MKHAIVIQPDYATAHFDLANMLQNSLQIQAEEGIIDNQATVQRYTEDSKALLFKTTLINNNHWEAHKALANIRACLVPTQNLLLHLASDERFHS